MPPNPLLPIWTSMPNKSKCNQRRRGGASHISSLHQRSCRVCQNLSTQAVTCSRWTITMNSLPWKYGDSTSPAYQMVNSSLGFVLIYPQFAGWLPNSNHFGMVCGVSMDNTGYTRVNHRASDPRTYSPQVSDNFPTEDGTKQWNSPAQKAWSARELSQLQGTREPPQAVALDHLTWSSWGSIFQVLDCRNHPPVL